MTPSEEFLLLALEGKRGVPCPLVDYGLAGLALRELAERGRIRIDGCRFAVVSERSTGDEALDGALSAFAHTEWCHALRYWVRELGQAATARPALLARLTDAGAMRGDEHAPGWPPRRSSGSRHGAGPHAEATARVRAVLLDGAAADAPTTTLIGMLAACRLLGGVLTRGEQRRAKRRIRELTESDPISRAAAAVVADVEIVKRGAPEPRWAPSPAPEARWTRAVR